MVKRPRSQSLRTAFSSTTNNDNNNEEPKVWWILSVKLFLALRLPSSFPLTICLGQYPGKLANNCHVSGKTSVLAVRCWRFRQFSVTNNNGHPSLTHTCISVVPQQSHTACSHTCTVGDPLTDSLSLSRNIICKSQPWYFIQFTIVILTTATLLHTINVNPGATK